MNYIWRHYCINVATLGGLREMRKGHLVEIYVTFFQVFYRFHGHHQVRLGRTTWCKKNEGGRGAHNWRNGSHFFLVHCHSWDYDEVSEQKRPLWKPIHIITIGRPNVETNEVVLMFQTRPHPEWLFKWSDLEMDRDQFVVLWLIC